MNFHVMILLTERAAYRHPFTALKTDEYFIRAACSFFGTGVFCNGGEPKSELALGFGERLRSQNVPSGTFDDCNSDEHLIFNARETKYNLWNLLSLILKEL